MTIDPAGREGMIVDGRYRIGPVLGAGGMGIVYAAEHVELGVPLAIKVMRAELANDLESVARFRREARAVSSLGHPGIVDVRDVGRMPDGPIYCVMERLEGRVLEETIGAPMEPRRAIRIALGILDALAAAHRHGIVHRDLKPENVFLVAARSDADAVEAERVKVLDFGVAKILGDDAATGAALPEDARLTGQFVLGTPAYMSPEQCAAQPIDARSDLYALGVLLYELLTGVLPFDHDDPATLMRLHCEQPPFCAIELVPTIPAALDAIVMRCLAKDRDERPPSAEALASELRALQIAEGTTPVPTAIPLRSEPPIATDARTASAYAVLGAGLVLAALGSAGLLAAIVAFVPDDDPAAQVDPITAPVPIAPIAETVATRTAPETMAIAAPGSIAESTTVESTTVEAPAEPAPELDVRARRRARMARIRAWREARERAARERAAAERARRADTLVDPWDAPGR